MKFKKSLEKTGKIILSILPHFVYEILIRLRYWIGALCAISANANNFGIKINGHECVVLGNGPSLADSLSDPITRSFINDKFKITVNNSILTSEFFELKPSLHVMIDPDYWGNTITDTATRATETFRLINDRLEEVDWPLQIFFPFAAKNKHCFRTAAKNINISFNYFNAGAVPSRIQGEKIRFLLYKVNKKMPKAQNVLVACIYLAINAGFKKIYLFGADHSWHEDIHVTNENIVCMRHTHFYSKEETFQPIWKSTSHDSDVFTMAEIFDAFSKTFKTYEELAAYARYRNAIIYNMSKKSYIDAFERLKALLSV